MTPRAIGPYALEGELGRGGMGVVYRARDPAGLPVALKLIAAGQEPEVLAFARERRLQEALGREAGFVPLLDAGTDRGAVWLVMPILEGGSLRDLLRAGPLPLRRGLELVRALAQAAGRAHALGVVHRDLKPENVLFDGAGRPFIADLGLAKHFLPGRSVDLTGSGAVLGTPGYMAPEQLGDGRSAGPAADVFALGALLFECLSGQPPFQGGGPLQYMQALEQPAPTLGSRGVQVPAWVEELVRRCLAREPRDRPLHAGVLAEAIEQGLRSGTEANASRRLGPALAASLVLCLGVVAAGLLGARRGSGEVPAPAAEQVRFGPPVEWTAVPRHTGNVHYCVISPDGSTALSTGQDERVLVWDLKASPPRARAVRLPGPREDDGRLWATGAEFELDGRGAWVGTTAGTIQRLEIDSAAWTRRLPVGPIPANAHPWMIRFAPDGRLSAAWSDGKVRAWARSKEGPEGDPEVIADHGPAAAFALDWLQDGRLVTGAEGAVGVWKDGELAARTPVPGHSARVSPLPGHDRILVGCRAGLSLWDPADVALETVWSAQHVNDFALSKRTLYAAGMWGGGLSRRDLETGTIQQVEGTATGAGIGALAVTGEESLLMVGHTDGRVRFLEPRTPRWLEPETPPAAPIVELVLREDGTVASTSRDGSILTWQSTRGRRVGSASTAHPPRELHEALRAATERLGLFGALELEAVDPDGSVAVTAHAPVGPGPASLCLWSLVDGQPTLVEAEPQPDPPSALLFLGPGDLLVGTDGGMVLRRRLIGR